MARTQIALVLAGLALASAGLVGRGGPTGNDVVEIDTDTGKAKTVYTFSGFLQSEQLSGMDSKQGVLYVMGEMKSEEEETDVAYKTYLKGVNLNTGKIVGTWTVPYPEEGLVGVGESLAVDSLRNVVYALGPASSEFHKDKVIQIDIGNQTVKTIGYPGSFHAVIGVATSFCPKSNTLWYPSVNKSANRTTIDLLGYNVMTKSLTKVQDVAETGPMAYNPADGKVYGLGIKVGADHKFSRWATVMDCATGVITELGEVTKEYVIVNDDLIAIDGVNDIGYALLAPLVSGKLGKMKLVSWNIKTGKFMKAVAVTDKFWGLHWWSHPKN